MKSVFILLYKANQHQAFIAFLLDSYNARLLLCHICNSARVGTVNLQVVTDRLMPAYSTCQILILDIERTPGDLLKVSEYQVSEISPSILQHINLKLTVSSFQFKTLLLCYSFKLIDFPPPTSPKGHSFLGRNVSNQNCVAIV